jgi:DNA polymerase-3 subunit epsilon
MLWALLILVVAIIVCSIIMNNIKNKKIKEEEKKKAEQDERNRIYRETKEKIERFFNEHEEFKNGKLFHGVSENAILVGRNGDIGFFNESLPDGKILNIRDVKSVKSASQDVNFYCAFQVNDFDNPFINITLDFCWDKEDRASARALYDKIKATIDSLKIHDKEKNIPGKISIEKGKRQRKLLTDYVVIDIETTGLDPRRDEILELSAIKVKDDIITDKFSTLCRPEKEISPSITEINGITNDMVKDALGIKEALELYISFIGDSVIMGHNINFDINFIYENYNKLFSKPFKNNFVDTLELSRKVCTNLKHHKLSDMVRHYKINTEQMHRGLNDCMATYQIYLKLKEAKVE